jgi:hypothetical protein
VLSKILLEYFCDALIREKEIVIGIPLVSSRDVVCASFVITNIIGTILTNVPLGMPQPLCMLFTMTCCGPLSYPSFSRYKYFLTFIYDLSRRTWVYFLKHKNEVFDKFLA